MENLLDKLGLKKSEKKVVLTLSSSGRPLSVAEISRISNIPITTAYKIIKHLVDRGFVKAVGGRPARYTASYPIEMISIEIQEKIEGLMRIWSTFSEISNSSLLIDLMRDCLPDAVKIGEKSIPVVLEWMLSKESDLRVLIPTSLSFPYRNLLERIKKGRNAVVLVDLDSRLADELEEAGNPRIRKVRNRYIFGMCNGEEAVLGVERDRPNYIYLKNELSALFDPLFESFLRRSIPMRVEGSA